MSKPVLRETVWLTMICMIDLASTVVLLKLGLAKEANPVLTPYLNHSLGAFVAAKTFLSIMPLVCLEMIGWLNPRVAKLGVRVGIAGYLGVYVIGSLRIHGLL